MTSTNPFSDPAISSSSTSSASVRIVEPKRQQYPAQSDGIPLASINRPAFSTIRPVGVGGASTPTFLGSQPAANGGQRSPGGERALQKHSSGGILRPSRTESFTDTVTSDGSDASSPSAGGHSSNGFYALDRNGMTTNGGTYERMAGSTKTTTDRGEAARQQVQRALSGNGNGSGLAATSGHRPSASYAAPTSSSATSPLGPNPGPTRTRRSLSSTSIDSPPTGSYSFPLSQNAALKQPNLVPVGEKLKSRHADVIDKWDGTGVGRGMLHHSGPYDAAAPSRNVDPTAPMKAFADVSGGSGTGLMPPQPSRSYSSTDKSPLSTPGIDDLVPVLNSTGLGPPSSYAQADGRPSRALSQRAQAALRGHQTGSPSRSGQGGMDYRHVPMGGSTGIGSLQGQYSTSLPTSGGFIPTSISGGNVRDGGSGSSAENHGNGLSTVEETNMLGGGMRMGESGGGFGEDRRFRERDREQKRRALKAAWGIDEPEPYEQFGYSGGPTTDEPVQLNDYPLPSPHSPSKARSPGLRLIPSRSGTPTEQDGNTGQNVEYFGPKSGNSTGSTGSESPGVGGAFRQGGLKRTKSLMHRLKAMRENPNMPPSDVEPRAPSPNGPYNEDTLGIRTSTDDLSAGGGGAGGVGKGRTRRNSWLRRVPEQGNHSAQPGSPEAQEEILDDSAGYPGARGGFQVIESPNSKSKTGRSGSSSRDKSGAIESSRAGSGGRARAATTSGGGGDKALPPPPVGQVMPDFANHSWQADPVDRKAGGIGTGGAGVQRKTSIMKKMKDKMGGGR